jgi:hypothetical protein
LNKAIGFVQESGLEYLSKELIKLRATDSLLQIRKCVVEMAADLEPNELKQACELKNVKLI